MYEKRHESLSAVSRTQRPRPKSTKHNFCESDRARESIPLNLFPSLRPLTPALSPVDPYLGVPASAMARMYVGALWGPRCPSPLVGVSYITHTMVVVVPTTFY